MHDADDNMRIKPGKTAYNKSKPVNVFNDLYTK